MASFLQGKFFAAWRETLVSVLRDRGALLLLVLAPLLYGFFYPWPYSTQSMRRIPVAVVDDDHSSLSRQIIRYTDASPRLSVQVLPGEAAAQDALWREEIFGYLILPAHMKHDVLMERPVHVSAQANAAYLAINKEVLTGFAEVVGTVSAGVKIRRLRAHGMGEAQALAAQNPVPLIMQPHYNPSQGYGSYVVPAVAILILQQTLLMGSALLIGTRVEEGSVRGSVWEWAGRVLALSAISWMSGLFYLGWMFFLQDYGRGGNMTGALLLLLVFSPTVSSIGCVLGLWFKQRERALQVLLFSSLPLFFLSGFSWPTEALPSILQYLRWLTPSTAAIEASVRFNQMGTALVDAGYLLVVLFLMGIVAFCSLCHIGRKL